MSATKLSEAGLKAVEDRNWQDAITNLSKAIEQSKSPAWLLARSQAYLETNQLRKAMRDAEYAYCVASERGNDKSRKQMIEATYRRSVAHFRAKEYANSDKLAVWSQRLAEGMTVKSSAEVSKEYVDEDGFYRVTVEEAMAEDKNNDEGTANADPTSRLALMMGGGDEKTKPYKKDWNKAHMFRATVVRFLEALPADDPARKVSVRLVPTKPSLEDAKGENDTKMKDPEVESAKARSVQSAPKPKVENANQPFRSQFYQTDSSITVSLFMKFASKEDTGKVQVDMQRNLITANQIPRDPSTLYLIPYAAIDPAKSTCRVAPMKMEFTLVKALPGKWPSFGREELSQPDLSRLSPADESPVPISTSGSGFVTRPPSIVSNSVPTAEKSKGPMYPTSSKLGPKDWEKLGNDEDPDEEPKDVDHFFKQLFANSTPEQQRAMMKSYTESNGTSLSTDWDSVSKGKVETEPPKGMEAKKWSD
ncbi:hypothetical protein VMCG_05507 [Cytospora schulzeri]|uniref:SGS domain-containing protein n=1 Tax=Cytospora schulzeri TaxID=448051 RepID=A0A423WEI4_9PEZI|nr:hypothetical protein VMCG_05507 [Valsa malicola]